MSIFLIVLAIILLIVLFIYITFNKEKDEIFTAKNELISNIHIIISYLPNLINLSKEEIKYEDEIFNNLENSKILFNNANGDIKTLSTCFSILNDNLNSLFTISEAYSSLWSSENFKKIKDDINDTLLNIEEIKNNYNSFVNEYNKSIETFPKKILAKIFKLNKFDLFSKPEIVNKIDFDIEKEN